jgi:hypothetical protein
MYSALLQDHPVLFLYMYQPSHSEDVSNIKM